MYTVQCIAEPYVLACYTVSALYAVQCTAYRVSKYIQSVPYHIRISPRFNAEICTKYSKNQVFLRANFYIRRIKFLI